MTPQPQNIEPQKSEVHESTADASTSPTGGADQETTRRTDPDRPPQDDSSKVPLRPPTDVRIIEDQTDDGGPLVVESSDPDLNPPRVPVDPFPTEGKPEIDPPVKK
jgi:hypothetical protein